MFSVEYHFFYSKKLEENKKKMVGLGQAPKEIILTNKVVDEDGSAITFSFVTKNFSEAKSIASKLGDVEYLTTTDIASVIKDGHPSLLAMSRLNMSAISRPSTKRGMGDNIFFFFSEKLSDYLRDKNVYDVVDVDGSVMRYNFCSTLPNEFLKLFSKRFDDFVLLTKTSAFSIIINNKPTSTARERVEFVSEHLGYFANNDVKVNNLSKLKTIIENSISKDDFQKNKGG